MKARAELLVPDLVLSLSVIAAKSRPDTAYQRHSFRDTASSRRGHVPLYVREVCGAARGRIEVCV